MSLRHRSTEVERVQEEHSKYTGTFLNQRSLSYSLPTNDASEIHQWVKMISSLGFTVLRRKKISQTTLVEWRTVQPWWMLRNWGNHSKEENVGFYLLTYICLKNFFTLKVETSQQTIFLGMQERLTSLQSHHFVDVVPLFPGFHSHHGEVRRHGALQILSLQTLLRPNCLYSSLDCI